MLAKKSISSGKAVYLKGCINILVEYVVLDITGKRYECDPVDLIGNIFLLELDESVGFSAKTDQTIQAKKMRLWRTK